MARRESHWVKVVSTQSNIRGVALDATELVRSLAELHNIKGEDARALGEATMGALLTACYCRAGERVNLNIQGTGVVKQALIEAYPEGSARGYIIPRGPDEIIAPISEDIGPWGSGLLSVLKTQDQEAQKPYVGTVPLVTGHLAKDLTFYWHQSEQVPSAVGLVVNLAREKVVTTFSLA
ncbi:MAG: Hsp33 family molecular chaperone HslO, partial [Bdellovibrionota bacterium]